LCGFVALRFDNRCRPRRTDLNPDSWSSGSDDLAGYSALKKGLQKATSPSIVVGVVCYVGWSDSSLGVRVATCDQQTAHCGVIAPALRRCTHDWNQPQGTPNDFVIRSRGRMRRGSLYNFSVLPRDHPLFWLTTRIHDRG